MRYTIEDLANGKCAVINDGTLEELHKVLGLAFSNDLEAFGSCKYYYKCAESKWAADSMTELPTQSVKDFLSEENPLKVEGQFITEGFPKRMRVWDNDKEYAKELIVLFESNEAYRFTVIEEGSDEDYLKGNKFSSSCYQNAEELTTKTELEKLKEQRNELDKKIKELEKQ